jgi:hypothetical protein
VSLIEDMNLLTHGSVLFVTFLVKGQKSSALMTLTEKGRPRYVNGKDHSMHFFSCVVVSKNMTHSCGS